MPLVEIWKDERYPDYGLSPYDGGHHFYGKLVEISAEEMAEYLEVSASYAALQKKLAEWSKRDASALKKDAPSRTENSPR